jgi:hypothetical protein
MKNLATLFTRVKRDFFPRFDTAGRWRCRKGSFTKVDGEAGYCDDAKGIIFVSEKIVVSRNVDLLTVVLVHEIAHAVLGDASHGKRFIARLGVALRRAPIRSARLPSSKPSAHGSSRRSGWAAIWLRSWRRYARARRRWKARANRRP